MLDKDRRCEICSKAIPRQNHSGVCSDCRDKWRVRRRHKAEMICRELGIPLEDDVALMQWVERHVRLEEQQRSAA